MQAFPQSHQVPPKTLDSPVARDSYRRSLNPHHCCPSGPVSSVPSCDLKVIVASRVLPRLLLAERSAPPRRVLRGPGSDLSPCPLQRGSRHMRKWGCFLLLADMASLDGVSQDLRTLLSLTFLSLDSSVGTSGPDSAVSCPCLPVAPFAVLPRGQRCVFSHRCLGRNWWGAGRLRPASLAACCPLSCPPSVYLTCRLS